MQLYFLVPSTNKVIHDVRRRRISPSTAEPFRAGEASDNAASIVNTAVAGRRVSLVSSNNLEMGKMLTRKHAVEALCLLQP